MSRALYRGSTPERVKPQLSIEEPGSPTKARDEQGSEERAWNRPVWETCFPHSMRVWIKQNLSFSSSSTFSLLPVFLLCLIGALVLISVAALIRPIPRVVFPPHNYRRAQLLAWRDVLRGGILGRGTLISDPREVATCPDGMEDYIPCYNVTANLEAGYKDGREFEPHCELSNKIQCLVPTPKDYQVSLKWPDSIKGIWPGSLQINEATVENRFVVEDNLLKFPANDQKFRNNVGSYLQQVSGLLGLSGVTNFIQAGIRSVLDISCGFGSLGAHLWEHNVLTMCVAPYEEHGGQVQITLERGFPAMVGSLAATQLPYPTSSYDLIHCADCGLEGHLNHDLSILEIDRLLRVGGYFVWLMPVQNGLPNYEDKALSKMLNLTTSLGWGMISPFEHDKMVIWQKKAHDMDSMIQNVNEALFCGQSIYDGDWAWQQPLSRCIILSPSHRQISVQDQLVWPERLQLADTEAAKSGPEHDETTGEPRSWTGTVADYWSLLIPGIFSDHPMRLGDEEVGPSANLVRNMMDMNAGHGALNAALMMSGKQVWVMNVIPTSASNTLPFIFDRGLIGTLHDWCEPFPTYPRTYDFLHAADLLSQELKRQSSCGLANLFLEMDRILRPEGWVLLRDDTALIEDARAAANQMHWESRLIEVLGDKEQRLLVCQKTLWKV